MRFKALDGHRGFAVCIFPNVPLKFAIFFFSEPFALRDRRMSDRFHLKDGIATPALTVIVALIFVLVLFSKSVEWAGPSSGGLVSQTVGNATWMAR